MAENNEKEYESVLDELEAEFKALREETHRQQRRLTGLVGRLRDLRPSMKTRITKEVKRQILQEQIDTIFPKDNLYDVQKRLWLTPNQAKSKPPFIPVTERPIGLRGVSTRFVSIINFKGGVGKTTITANIGAAFATGQYNLPNKVKGVPLNVLFVDLDFQGTLTDRCVPTPSLNTNITGAAELFNYPPKIKLSKLLMPVVALDNAKIIPSVDILDAKDSEAFMRLACGLLDTRFFFRRWFHNSDVLSQFDLVLFDCPPRFTASTMCALTTSDFAFIPTTPDLFDQAPIVRTSSFINRLCRTLKTPCQIGGIILNRTAKEGALTAKEKNFIARINVPIDDNVDSLPFLKTHIPKRSGEKDSIVSDLGDPIPGGLPKRLPFIKDLASEIYARIYQ